MREVQRRLRRLGYRPGRVDGRFGPRTESAVRWFQVKHAIPAVGVVDAATLGHLRERTASGAAAGEPGTRLPEPAEASPPATPVTPTTLEQSAKATTPADQGPASSRTWSAALIFAVLVAAALIAVVGVAIAGRLRRKPLIVPVSWPLWAEGRRHDGLTGAFEGPVHAIAVSRKACPQVVHYLIGVAGREPFWATSDELHWFGAPPEQPEAQSQPRAIGYVLAPSDPSSSGEAVFSAQAAAIEAECARQGWQLDQIVRDPRFAPGTPGHTRRGFAHALERIADAEAQALVVCEVQDLTRSAADLAILLDWFTDSQAALVALDIGLDTTSPAGELTHRALASLGAWERERHLSPEHTEVLDQVVQMRSEGLPVDEVAHTLINRPDINDGTNREPAELLDLADARRRRHHTDQGARHGHSA